MSNWLVLGCTRGGFTILSQSPVRNDEVISFFASDLKKPVMRLMQAGYKEGYLTKRGKNVGGWKTRFFVLQGPVLEYYESAGNLALHFYLVSCVCASAAVPISGLSSNPLTMMMRRTTVTHFLSSKGKRVQAAHLRDMSSALKVMPNVTAGWTSSPTTSLAVQR